MLLKGKTLFITGASRGIGKAIALRAARDGANVVIAAKTADPHPKLPGTIYSAAEEIEANGGKALPVQCDIRSEEDVVAAIKQAVDKFGGIDILVNNASAISLSSTVDTSVKKYDLMNQVNTRGTWMVSKHAIPHLIESAKRGRNPHILNLSPPLDMKEKWFGPHVAYTIAKFGMSMCVLGMAAELRPYGIAVNALWPQTGIDTAAIANIVAPGQLATTRKPEIMADAAYIIMNQESKAYSGNFTIDEDVIRSQGIRDLSCYKTDPRTPDDSLMPDFFIPDNYKFTWPPKKVVSSATPKL